MHHSICRLQCNLLDRISIFPSKILWPLPLMRFASSCPSSPRVDRIPSSWQKWDLGTVYICKRRRMRVHCCDVQLLTAPLLIPIALGLVAKPIMVSHFLIFKCPCEKWAYVLLSGVAVGLPSTKADDHLFLMELLVFALYVLGWYLEVHFFTTFITQGEVTCCESERFPFHQ